MSDQYNHNIVEENVFIQNDQNDNTQYVPGHIRGFHEDRSNKNVFGLNYDTTSTAEKERRLNRLARFGGVEAAEEINRIKRIDEQVATARSRLDRFTSNDDFNDNNNNNNTDFLGQSTTYQFPQIMPFEDLSKIPEDQVQYELNAFEPTAPRRWEVIHLFGTRLLAQNVRTEDLLEHYKADGLIKVEWLSDYRCNLVFSDHYAARRVLDNESFVKDLDVRAAMKHFPIIDANKTEQENSTSFDVDTLPFMVWRSSIHSEDNNTAKGSLVFRLATNSDIKEPLEVRLHSQFYLDNTAYFNQIISRRKAQTAYELRKLRQQARESVTGESNEQNGQQIDQHGIDKNITIVQIDPNSIPQARISTNQRAVNDRSVTGKVITTSKAALAAPDDGSQRVVINAPTGARGRGFTKGRSGTFDIDRGGVDIQKQNDFGGNERRERNRNYNDAKLKFLEQPDVHVNTPLRVTLAVIDSNREVAKELEAIQEEKRGIMEIKAQNNVLTRVPIDYKARPEVPAPMVTRTNNQMGEMPDLLPATTGNAVMYAHVLELDEIEREKLEKIKEEEKMQKELEKMREIEMAEIERIRQEQEDMRKLEEESMAKEREEKERIERIQREQEQGHFDDYE
jgi:hypothetical protein